MKTLAAIALSLSAAAVANAAIVTTAGACVQIGPPPFANFPTLAGPNAFAWDEQASVTVTGVFANMTTNPSTNGAPVPGLVTGTFNSHFVHFTGFVPSPAAAGTVVFDAPIAAVFYRDLELDNTDALFGAGGTTYPTTLVNRGTALPSFISINSNVLNFNLLANAAGIIDIEQIRVLTYPVPTPGAMALIGLGGLVVSRRRRV